MDPRLLEFGNAFVSATKDDLLLAISEGFIKVRCAESALTLGWTLQEGGGSNPSGPVADYLRIENGTLTCNRGPRLIQLNEGSADLAVVRPFQMMLEIKARPDFGTKAQAQFQEMYTDLRRVAFDQRCAFLFVFDKNQYRSFSGQKTETRGRKAIADASWFRDSFPLLEVISDDGIEVSRPVGDVALSLRFWLQRPSELTTRIVAIGARCDANFS